MTFQQYIDNPMGKRNAVFSQRELFKAMYVEKFDKILLREAGKINYTMYIDKKKDRYVIHIKVPSETVKDFYYDAVILFYTKDASVHASSSLQSYNVKFFSNDPAFVYTYLRVFLKNDMFFEDLKPKASKLALTKDPKQTNPYEIPGYSKILYFAFLYMKAKNLFAKHMFETYAIPYDPKKLLSNVEHADKKIADRQEMGIKQSRQASQEKHKESKLVNQTRNFDSSNNVKATKNISTTKKVNSVKRSPFVKFISKKK